MIDVTDTKTQDLIGGMPKKRGRPVTGTAKTAAQRKRDERLRAKASIYSETFDLGPATTGALCEMLSGYITGGWGQQAALVLKELTLRANRSMKQLHPDLAPARIAVIVTQSKSGAGVEPQ